MEPSTPTVLLLAVLAACQITETFRHGSLFERPRAWLESRGDFFAEISLRNEIYSETPLR